MFSVKSLILFLVISVFVFTGAAQINAQSKIRIGTYDSRLIAIAYYNSKYFKLMPEVMQRMKTAKEKNDTAEISNIGKEMSLRQRMMHEQGFGKGSVCDIMNEIKSKISELAKTENLNILVSKYELNFNDANAEIIDISVKVANLFEPSKNMEEMYKEAQGKEPIKEAFLLED